MWVTPACEYEPCHATSASPHFILISGKPIGEPIAWAGPIVMNTEEELRIACAELDDGTFIKKK